MRSSPRILIIRTDRLGDMILSTPVIRALRSAFPDAYLGMMVCPDHWELLDGNPDLNVVIAYDKDGSEKGIAGTLRFAKRLRSHRFNTALILHSTDRVIFMSWLAGIRRRIGYARRLSWLLTDRFPYVKREGTQHELDYNLDLLKALGVESKERTLRVMTNAAQEAKVEAFLRTHGIDGTIPFIVLHPGASCPSKRWPAKRFAAVGDYFAKKHGTRIIVVTGPGEIQHGENVLSRMKEPSIAALGVFSLGELACLLRKARCLISNDSGPVHLACAVQTPVVAIFGRWGGGLSPTRWGPTGPRSLALHHDVGCRPCLAHRCPIGFVCLEAVSVEEVIAAAQHVAGLKTSGTFAS